MISRRRFLQTSGAMGCLGLGAGCIGHLLTVRFNVRPEVTAFQLVRL
jgi:hypothetical protein